MKANRWLIAAVIVLAMGLAAQSFYLFQLKNDLAMEGRAAYPVALQGLNRSAYGGALPAQASSRRTSSVLPLTFSSRQSDPFSGAGSDQWDPFEEMDQIQNVMNRMFRDSFNRGPRTGVFAHPGVSYEPDLDVQETADAYLIRLDLPGVEKDKIEVKIQNNILLVSGERKAQKEETGQNGRFYRMESSYGSFMRSFPLPADADSNGMTAESKNGVLTIQLPKIKNAPSAMKSIQVQ